MFIPFLGAVIAPARSATTRSPRPASGWPARSSAASASAACILVWHATGSDLWRALAFTGFFLNLFNLLPVVPLDGGRAMAAMAPWMWFVGFAALIPLAIVFPNPIILMILVFAGFETYKRWQAAPRRRPAAAGLLPRRPLDRALVAAVYLSLIALLVVGMHATLRGAHVSAETASRPQCREAVRRPADRAGTRRVSL